MTPAEKQEFEMLDALWVAQCETLNFHMAQVSAVVKSFSKTNKKLYAIEKKHGVERTKVEPVK